EPAGPAAQTAPVRREHRWPNRSRSLVLFLPLSRTAPPPITDADVLGPARQLPARRLLDLVDGVVRSSHSATGGRVYVVCWEPDSCQPTRPHSARPARPCPGTESIRIRSESSVGRPRGDADESVQRPHRPPDLSS